MMREEIPAEHSLEVSGELEWEYHKLQRPEVMTDSHQRSGFIESDGPGAARDGRKLQPLSCGLWEHGTRGPSVK